MRPTKPTKANKTSGRLEIAEPSIGILLKRLYCNTLQIIIASVLNKKQHAKLTIVDHSLTIWDKKAGNR
tara:strand:- start:6887 stop:7093 length:207 start_codon:yes stop_codon:yes gene_type:complete